MSLTPGARLGPYEILATLGAGGMGEVYRARDTRLDRTVAIKVLPAEVASDPEVRARFEREARAIAALEHPHICAIYDVGEADQVRFLVMQCLEGESLATRLMRGSLPLDQLVKYAAQVADALDKAHRAGITHRDVKPANIMLTKAGAMLVDFGLAKLRGPAAPMSMSGMTALATTTINTANGTILGTVPYMAPEQVEGKEADARSDIWALGTVIYEMASGRRPFAGETPASVIGAILKDEPVPLSTLQPLSPPSLDHVVALCLAKDPDERWQSAGDIKRELLWAITSGKALSQASSVATRPPGRLGWILAATLGVALVIAATMAVRHLREAAPVVNPVQFTFKAPEESPFDGRVPEFAVSPDGRQIVFVAARQGALVLWIRPLSSDVATPLTGTEGPSHPFWSPDSESIGFFAGGKLKTVSANGGTPVELCNAPIERGGTWNRDGVILFAPSNFGPLQRVTLSEGTPSPATVIANGETSHRWPHFLPDGRHFLYFVGIGDSLTGEIRVGSLDSKETVPVTASLSNGAYASGHVLFTRSGNLMALPFDAETQRPTADAFLVAEQVFIDSTAYAAASVSTTNVLTYARGSARGIAQLTWFDPSGKKLGTVGDPGEYFNVSLSADERRVAVSLLTGTPANRDIWLIGGAHPRFTSDPKGDMLPIWSRDGSQIAFGSNRSGAVNIYLKAANGGSQEQPATKSSSTIYLTDWSRDGRYLAYSDQATGPTGLDIWVLPLSGDKTPQMFLRTMANEDNAVFSPDGHWIAYDSNETGRTEVYVKAFPPDSTGYRMVSHSGGWQPVWQDDNQLFYLAPDSTLMSVGISTAKGFDPVEPKRLFPTGITPPTGASVMRRQYAVTNDGKRFLVIAPEHHATPLTVVVNWLAALEKKR